MAYNIYIGIGEGKVRHVSGPVSDEDLLDRIATVRNCFADSPVHVTSIAESPYMSFLPKCAETGNCSLNTPEDVDNTMKECIG